MSDLPVKSNPHVPDNPILTMSDELLSIQRLMERIDSGEVPESRARLLLNGHSKLLKGAELQIQYRRMNQGKLPQREIRLIETADQPSTKSSTE